MDMLSKIPFDLKEMDNVLDDELIRIGIIAELDAINLYEQLAALAHSELIKKVFLDIAKEEKEHFGEFLTLLEKYDPEAVEAMAEGREEVKEMEKGGE